MSEATELAAQIKHLVDQQTQGQKPFVYGHIASYDPAQHRVTVILPSIRNEDGTPVLTGWMPLGTIWAGTKGQNPLGIQVAPFGGASFENPTDGEQVIVQVIERTYGVMVVASMLFNEVASAPDQFILPGECVIQSPSGSFLKFQANGEIAVHAPLLSADGNLTVGSGASGTFTSAEGLTITVQDGIVTNIF